MILSWVYLGYSRFNHGAPKNETALKFTGLGCKGSQIQILSRRPTYLAVITAFSFKISNSNLILKSAHRCSKMKAKEGVAGGKIGVFRQCIPAPSFCLKSARPTHIISATNLNLNSNSHHGPGGHHGTYQR